jgi:hypothetical protein
MSEAMKKCVVICGLLVLAGCASKVARWEDAGTLVSVRPADQPPRAPGRIGTALGENELGRTRVETTEGVYVVSGKINVAQVGDSVKLGFAKAESPDEPTHLAVGGQQYQISQ